MKVSAAAKILVARNNHEGVLLRLHWSFVARIYDNWLAFGPIPHDTPRFYLKRRNGSWTAVIDDELKRLIEFSPVSYLRYPISMNWPRN